MSSPGSTGYLDSLRVITDSLVYWHKYYNLTFYSILSDEESNTSTYRDSNRNSSAEESDSPAPEGSDDDFEEATPVKSKKDKKNKKNLKNVPNRQRAKAKVVEPPVNSSSSESSSKY